jgi:hypothetical protein
VQNVVSPAYLFPSSFYIPPGSTAALSSFSEAIPVSEATKSSLSSLIFGLDIHRLICRSLAHYQRQPLNFSLTLGIII